ncbi:hypothetical protein vseg_012263 [Gypsophila vaccaria]
MAGETDENVGAMVVAAAAAESPTMAATAKVDEKRREESNAKEVTPKKKKGIISRVWNGLFGSRKDDFERRLERLSKEEATVLTRMRRRAQSWGRLKRHIIMFSVLLEIVAVAYAIMTARTAENWKIRAFHVLPMFLLPVLSSLTYTALSSFINMCEKKDQKILENLRTERKSKIDELKEKTNYYITQQLIQRYDTDPAAKAAAAAVLASKLGADSGLKVFLGDQSVHHASSGKSNDVEHTHSDGLRNRKQAQARATSPGGTVIHNSSAASPYAGSEYTEQNQQQFVDHNQAQGPTAYNSGWLSRIAALLVGEDPTQCYALICGNCHMHNGLASKEDFPYVTYICPHCRAINGPKIHQDRASGTSSPGLGSTISADHENANSNIVNGPKIHQDRASGTSSPGLGFTISADHENANSNIVNGPKIHQDRASGTSSPGLGSTISADNENANSNIFNGPKIHQDLASGTSSPGLSSTISADHENANSNIVDSPHDAISSIIPEVAPEAAEVSVITDKTETAVAND